MMTNQQIFNKVVKHLLKQGVKSINRGKCLYRGPSGLKCAVGCLIPDKLYIKEIEGKTIGGMTIFSIYYSILANILKKSGVGTKSFVLLDCLQDIHDHQIVKHWPEDLKQAAKLHNLKVPKILEKACIA